MSDERSYNHAYNVDKRPKKITDAFSRGQQSKSFKKSLHDRHQERYTKVESTASLRSSHSSFNKKQLEKVEYENMQFYRKSKDLEKIQEDLKKECDTLKCENQELKKVISEKDAQIDELSQKLEELQHMKLTSKQSKFSNLRQNFQSMFHRRKTKDELVSKKILQNEPNFQTTLEKMDKDVEFKNVPRVLVESVKVLESKYMHVVGLYRISGNYATVQDMRFHINSNNFKVLKEQKDPHTITGIIKLLFRELEEPLISLKHLDQYIDDCNFLSLRKEYQIMAVQTLVEKLHPVHRDTLQYLMKHLNKVINTHGNQNNAGTLSVVVGACIFYELLSDVDFQMNLAKCTVTNKCIEIMIEEYSAIFEQV
ncbi:hypothetical protein DMENIID0001_151200 [Sergentomyia squamirostris]